jgi:hypothetical protein
MTLITVEQFVFYLFIPAAVIQTAYYLFLYTRVARYVAKTDYSCQPPVSIVICAKNEALKLHKNIPLYFQQEYPQFQVP